MPYRPTEKTEARRLATRERIVGAALERVAESAAVGVPHPLKGETIWCFVVVKPGIEPDARLARELRNVVADHLGRSFLPGRVVFVPQLPKTRSAKIVRRAIRAVAVGEDPGDLSSLEDPEAIAAIEHVLGDA